MQVVVVDSFSFHCFASSNHCQGGFGPASQNKRQKKYSLMNFEVFSNPRKSYLRVFEQTSQTILLSQNLGEI